ncbi:hypothetical protein [Teredinibacter franksiae]|uniref:hypothetical protein n=1 Tax=Teredinibacter franksiae TaxID=2761453 RepID=UPI0016250EF1|nr:hypothetical protein [Teredinibacter franksiae]
MNIKRVRILLVIVICMVGVSGCDSDPYHGFGCIAPESHPAVEKARSLSSDQLEMVYFQVQKISEAYSKKNYETQFLKSEIPQNLSFLNADLIRVYRSRGPYIVLANCFDERIELALSHVGESEPTVTLYWAAPTNENPYARGSQIIWRKNKEG